MSESLPKTNLPALSGKRCIVCLRMSPMKNSKYCYRCSPEKSDSYLPTFNKLTTVEGIRRAYGNLLNAIRKQKISREEAGCLFYGLNGFVKSMKLILDMKIELEKTDNKPIVTDVKIEQLKSLVEKLDRLHQKFKDNNEPQQSGEIEKIAEENIITALESNKIIG